MSVRGNPARIFCEGVRWGDLDSASYKEIVHYFQKRVENSFFEPVKRFLLPEYKTTGFVILAVTTALIDLLCQYYYGEPNTKQKDKFKRYLREHLPEFTEPVSIKQFPHVKDFADFFYEGFRCQILHNFMLSEHSTIGWKTDLIHVNTWNLEKGKKEVIVNPRVLIERLEQIFSAYIEDLLSEKKPALKESFIKKLQLDTGVKIKHE